MMIEGFEWPRPEDIARTSLERTLTSNELLALKSRSFYFPIWLLELVRGRDENNKRVIITDLYNILREEDTCEDVDPKTVNVETKRKAIDYFAYIINDLSRRSPSESITDLIEVQNPDRPNLTYLTSLIIDGATADEKIFLEHFGRGVVLQSVRSYGTQKVKEAMAHCVNSMEKGMRRFLEAGKVDSIEELNEYCDYVAADVGFALNRIVFELDRVKLDDNDAKSMGRFLQLVNINKNTEEDYEQRGVTYIPRNIHSGVEEKDLFETGQKDFRKARKAVLETMLNETRKNSIPSADYISSIPRELTGYGGFVLFSYLAAVETLNLMEEAGAERVFAGDKEAIKIIPETAANLRTFTYAIMKIGAGKRVGDFMTLYKEAQKDGKYNQYSFKPGSFEKWSEEFLAQ